MPDTRNDSTSGFNHFSNGGNSVKGNASELNLLSNGDDDLIASNFMSSEADNDSNYDDNVFSDDVLSYGHLSGAFAPFNALIAANPNALAAAAISPNDADSLLSEADSPPNTVYGAGETPFDATPVQVAAAVGATSLAFNGSGLKIGVMSSSFNGDGVPVADLGYGTVLPTQSQVKILQDADTGVANDDEGRAMMQVVHDVASGASLDFYTALGGVGTSQWDQDFANGITALANDGCKVICEDISVEDAPWFQSSVITQAIQTFEQSGGIFVSCAGNQASAAYQSAWNSTSYVVDDVQYDALNFGTAQDPTPFSLVTVPAGGKVQFYVQWAQPWGDATTNLQLVVSQDNIIEYTAENSSNVSGETTDPMIDPASDDSFTNNTDAAETFQVTILDRGGPEPSLVKYVAYGDGAPITIAGANAGTTAGDNESPYQITVGAVSAGNTPAFGNPIQSEDFSSSDLGAEWLFNSSGVALSSPQLLSPITISGVDDINASDAVGGTNYNSGFDDFFGTSCATPTVAAVIGDMLQANSKLTFAQIEQMIEETALWNGARDENIGGSGLVDAAAAIQLADGDAPISVAEFVADQVYLDAGLKGLTNGYPIADLAANVAAQFGALNADSNVSAITLTDSGTPVLDLTAAQAASDTTALGAITNQLFGVAVGGSTQYYAGGNGAGGAPIALQASNVGVTLKANSNLNLTGSGDNVTVGAGSNLAISGGGDTMNFASGAADHASLTGTSGVWDVVNGSNGGVQLTTAQAAIFGGGDTVNFAGGSGNAVSLYNTGGNLDTVSGAGNGVVVLGSAQASILSGDDTVIFAGGGAVELSSAAANTTTIDGFGVGDTIDLTFLGAPKSIAFNAANDHLTVSGATAAATLQLSGNFSGLGFFAASDGHSGADIIALPDPATIAQYQANKTQYDEISTGLAISDTAANVGTNLSALNADARVISVVVNGGVATWTGVVGVSAANFSIAGGASVTFAESFGYGGTFSEAAGVTLDLAGGSLTLSGSDTFAGGTIDGSNRLYAQGTTLITDGLTIGGTASLENQKTLTQSGGAVTVGDNAGNKAELYNASTGTYAIADNSGIGRGSSTVSFIVNSGLFEKTGGTLTSAIAASFTDTGTVTVVSGTLSFSGPSNSFAGAITGAGTVLFAGGSTSLKSGASASVDGLSETGAGTTLTIAENLSYGGVFTEGAGSTLVVDSGDTLTLTGTTTLAGTTSGAGTLELSGGGSTTIDSGAKISVSAWSLLGSGTSATLEENLGYAGTFGEAAGDTFDLAGGSLMLTGADTFAGGTIDGSNRLYAQGTTLITDGLTIGGTASLENQKTVTQSGGAVTVGDNAGNKAELYNASTGTYAITDNSGIGRGSSTASFIVNAGMFEKTGGTATSAIAPALTNTGTVLVSSGVLDLQGAVSGTGADTISGASTLEFGSTVASGQTIGLTGADGTLDLGDPQGFSGEISGFDTVGSNDTLEIAAPWTYFSFSENAADTQGTLTFANGATHTSVTLLGNYTAANFVHQSGPGGSTLVTYT